jgi:hypothetical protein
VLALVAIMMATCCGRPEVGTIGSVDQSMVAGREIEALADVVVGGSIVYGHVRLLELPPHVGRPLHAD